jgi:micrococcal nuclease
MNKFLAFVYLLIFSSCSYAQLKVTAVEAKDHVNQIVTVCDRIAEGVFLENHDLKWTLLNIGAAHPDQTFSIGIKQESRANFPFKPEEYYLNKKVCVVGKIVDFMGKPQIVVLSPAEIIVDFTDTVTVLSSSNIPPASALTTIRDSIVNQTKSAARSGSTTNADTARQTVISNKAPGSTINPKTSNPVNANTKVTGTENRTPPGAYPIKVSSNLKLLSLPLANAEVMEVLKAGSVVLVLRSENGWSYVSFQRKSSGEVLKGFIQNRLLK